MKHQRPYLRTGRTKLLSALAAVVLLGVTGCNSTPAPPDPAPFSPLPPKTYLPSIAPAVTTAAVAPPAAAGGVCTPPSLRDCFDEASMQRYIDTVLPLITAFFTASYKAMPAPSQYIYINLGTTSPSACDDGTGNYTETDMTYDYCPLDNKVYLGQQMMWKLYSQAGDAAPAVGLAHEWGHNLQTHVGVPAPTTLAEAVNHENQADCVAGAWIQYAIGQGEIEQEDIGTTVNLLGIIASAETPDRDHGDLQERAASMEKGLDGGLVACNSFYPATPIYTP